MNEKFVKRRNVWETLRTDVVEQMAGLGALDASVYLRRTHHQLDRELCIRGPT
jgi:hypothetical protein